MNTEKKIIGLIGLVTIVILVGAVFFLTKSLARKFVTDHKKSLGDINLEGMSLETGQKDGGGNKVNYFFKWTSKDKTAYQETQCGDVDKSLPGVFYDDKGNPCANVTLYHTPSLSMTVTSGGQVVVYSNELATR